jgi:hypothetical protein
MHADVSPSLQNPVEQGTLRPWQSLPQDSVTHVGACLVPAYITVAAL